MPVLVVLDFWRVCVSIHTLMGKVASGHAPGLSGAVFSPFHCARHESVSSGIYVARHEPKVLTFQIQQDVLRDGLVMMLASFSTELQTDNSWDCYKIQLVEHHGL